MLDHDHDDMMSAVDDLMAVEEEEAEAEEDREEREAVDKIIRWAFCRKHTINFNTVLVFQFSSQAFPKI